MKYCILVILVLLTLASDLPAQSRNRVIIGLNIAGELHPDNFRLSQSGTYEVQIGKRSGFETGIYYHSIPGVMAVPNAMVNLGVVEVTRRHLIFPVLYKFYSRVINFAAGPSLDAYLGFRDSRGKKNDSLEPNDQQDLFTLGYLMKISKDIRLTGGFIIAPEVRFGSIGNLGSERIASGLGLKYQL